MTKLPGKIALAFHGAGKVQMNLEYQMTNRDHVNQFDI